MSADEVPGDPPGREQAAAPAFLTAIEAAAILRWLPDTVRRKAAAGELPGVRLGRHWRFEREQLMAYVRGEWRPANAPPRGSPITRGELAAEIFRNAPRYVGKRK